MSTFSSFILCTFVLVVNIKNSFAFRVNADSVEQWDRFEMELNGPSDGNPFTDYELSAEFIFEGTGDNEPFNVDGFYDGNGIYRIRFMPNQIGSWSYTTKSNVESMNNQKGTFTATTPSKYNHGPAHVNYDNNRTFIFANGDPYFQTGTTTYAWYACIYVLYVFIVCIQYIAI